MFLVVPKGPGGEKGRAVRCFGFHELFGLGLPLPKKSFFAFFAINLCRSQFPVSVWWCRRHWWGPKGPGGEKGRAVCCFGFHELFGLGLSLPKKLFFTVNKCCSPF